MVSFGQDALVEDPPEHHLEFEGFDTSPGANFTDIESALRLAGSMAQTGTRRHVVVVSDGRQNVGDAVGEARVLRSEGVRVDVLPLRVPLGPDVRVDSVEVPPTVPPGSRAQATAVLVSNETTTARVVWSLDNSQVVLDTVVRVRPRCNRCAGAAAAGPSWFSSGQCRNIAGPGHGAGQRHRRGSFPGPRRAAGAGRRRGARGGHQRRPRPRGRRSGRHRRQPVAGTGHRVRRGPLAVGGPRQRERC